MHRAALAFALIACASTPAPPPARPPEAPARPPEAPAVRCGAPIALDAAIAPHRIVAIGELHGTVEIPRMVGELVCRIASGGGEVILAIEHEAGEQAAIDHAVATGDPAQLLAQPLWTKAHQDGRSSEAMLALVLRVHELRAAGLPVSIVAMDSPSDGAWPDRDPHMARVIGDAARRRPDAKLIVLTGLSHAWKVRGAPWNADFESAVRRVIAQGLPVHSVEVRQDDAEHWGCFPKEPMKKGEPYRGGLECRAGRQGDPSRRIAAPTIGPYPGKPASFEGPVQLTTPDAFDAQLDLGGLSASRPAVAP